MTSVLIQQTHLRNFVINIMQYYRSLGLGINIMQYYRSFRIGNKYQSICDTNIKLLILYHTYDIMY